MNLDDIKIVNYMKGPQNYIFVFTFMDKFTFFVILSV